MHAAIFVASAVATAACVWAYIIGEGIGRRRERAEREAEDERIRAVNLRYEAEERERQRDAQLARIERFVERLTGGAA